MYVAFTDVPSPDACEGKTGQSVQRLKAQFQYPDVD